MLEKSMQVEWNISWLNKGKLEAALHFAQLFIKLKSNYPPMQHGEPFKVSLIKKTGAASDLPIEADF